MTAKAGDNVVFVDEKTRREMKGHVTFSDKYTEIATVYSVDDGNFYTVPFENILRLAPTKEKP